MDPDWLLHNLSMSWSRRAHSGDFVRQMLWRYAGRMPRLLRRPNWTIAFHCPPPAGGVRLLVRDNAGADLFIYSEVFEHEYYDLPLDRPPATILDIGANIGLTAIYFARAFPDARIACVEPVDDNLRLLRRNLDMNGICAEIFAAAAHVDDGSVTMERAATDYGHRVADTATSAGGALFTVAAITVPTMLQHLGWERIGLAKIDIEGHEIALLSQNCDWLHAVDTLCLEYHGDHAEAHLTAVAGAYDFQLPQLMPAGLWLLTR